MSKWSLSTSPLKPLSRASHHFSLVPKSNRLNLSRKTLSYLPAHSPPTSKKPSTMMKIKAPSQTPIFFSMVASRFFPIIPIMKSQSDSSHSSAKLTETTTWKWMTRGSSRRGSINLCMTTFTRARWRTDRAEVTNSRWCTWISRRTCHRRMMKSNFTRTLAAHKFI